MPAEDHASRPTRRQTAARLGALVLALGTGALAGCALMPGHEPPRVSVVGIERVAGEGMELRFALRLRVQNPSAQPIEYDGIWLELDVNGRPLASGVSAERGTVPRYGEVLVNLPVSVSATAAVRQMLGLTDGLPRGELPYAVRGRLSGGPLGGLLGTVRFSSEGVIKLPN